MGRGGLTREGAGEGMNYGGMTGVKLLRRTLHQFLYNLVVIDVTINMINTN